MAPAGSRIGISPGRSPAPMQLWMRSPRLCLYGGHSSNWWRIAAECGCLTYSLPAVPPEAIIMTAVSGGNNITADLQTTVSGTKAIALLNRLKSTHPDRFSDTHLRTLQRRVQQWRGITAQKNWSTPRLVNPWRTPCNAGISAAWGGPQVAKVSVTSRQQPAGLIVVYHPPWNRCIWTRQRSRPLQKRMSSARRRTRGSVRLRPPRRPGGRRSSRLG